HMPGDTPPGKIQAREQQFLKLVASQGAPAGIQGMVVVVVDVVVVVVEVLVVVVVEVVLVVVLVGSTVLLDGRQGEVAAVCRRTVRRWAAPNWLSTATSMLGSDGGSMRRKQVRWVAGSRMGAPFLLTGLQNMSRLPGRTSAVVDSNWSAMLTPVGGVNVKPFLKFAL